MRYIHADESLTEVFMQVLEERFTGLGNLYIMLVYDTKKKISKGKITLAHIEKANDKVKYYTANGSAIEGYDYLIFVDKNGWEIASEKDRKRIISHELRHILIDSDTGKLSLVPHDIEDFRYEQELNKDNPSWAYELGLNLKALYETKKEDK